MTKKLAFLLVFCDGIASACTCRGLSTADALSHAEVVFRGTIVKLRDPGSKSEQTYGGRKYKIAVFRVDRVWKGNVGKLFEMPALKEEADCIGFWPDLLKVGSDLLVYAFRMPPYSQYVTSVCTHTGLARKSTDFQEMGPGRPPDSK